MAKPPTSDGTGRREAAPHAHAETINARGPASPDAGVVETVASATGPSAPGHVITAPTRALARGELSKGTVVGDYVVDGKLGEGGMGRVYGAVHPVIGKKAAIKVLRPELCASTEVVARFVKEARAVNQIGHPNIVDIFAFGELDDGRSYLVMERLEGESLAARLRRERPRLDEACRILGEIVGALQAAHEERIIHRDLKPDNVYLCTTRGGPPRIKLLDFGIAKLLDDEAHRVERTRTGNLMGTPQYIAPEQARGYDVDEAVDVYSLGVMAFEMLTGRPPFVADNAMDMVAKHLHEAPPSPATLAPGLPPSLVALVLAMLAKEPGDRPGLARVKAVLEEARVGTTGMLPFEAQVAATMPETTLPRPVVVARRRSRTWLVALALALAGGGGAVAAFVIAGGGSGGGQARLRAPGSGLQGPDRTGTGTGTETGMGTGTGTGSEPVTVAVDAGVAAGSVRIDLKDGPATVAIDGVVVSRDRRHVELALPAGRHQLEVTAPRRRAHVATLDVVAGQALVVPVTLVRDGRSSGPAAGERAGSPRSGTDQPTSTPPPRDRAKPRPADDDEGTIDPFGSTKTP